MAKGRDKLSAVMVRQAPAGKYGDGGGLWLCKGSKDAGSWVLRVAVHGRLRHMGLGSISDVGLKEARDAAEKWRATVRAGNDPIKVRERAKREAARNLHMLKDVADDFFEGYKARLKGDGTAGRWFSPLTLHVLPRLGKVPVANLDQVDIRDTLRPLRDTKPETMRKALNRLNLVVRHAAALGLDVDTRIIDKARALIGSGNSKAGKIPAMAWQDVPAFYASLNDGSVTHLALRLLILTGVRSAPLRFIREDQITREKIDGHEIDIWTVPAEAMKGRKGQTEAFRVPLSAEAMNVIEQAKRLARGGYLFPNVTGKGVASDMTLSMFMRRAKLEARPHGFRSSLRDWLAEATDAPHEVAETILQHVAGSKVTRAYRRTDFIEQRRALMERWADHATGNSGKIVRLVEAHG
ncbi:site-specific integrase [Bradyrhizobium sp. JYMT SZCCT0180]|uniref:tyrosine-type recombinase/integrase n=1 Tax=Bradyrhizobium sp. JYMT SZCCT0180 TaxID=2807666 RepID=UPI001BA9F11C|nr:site-specific integrase [Bradyrhizobium sp. JYMT SZCCT0180]MBR1209466.1 integrase arm-type DNA-binding domain-containing protein [Bradyrhizobium sp. JYMT SZCCT0180]